MFELLAGLGQPELREIYSSTDPVSGERFGVHPVDLEEWERWRKYAYAKYWENRLDEDRALSEQEIQDWQEYIPLDFLNNVASSVVGDAARRNLLPEVALRALAAIPSITPYASRQLRARLALLEGGPMEKLVNDLLELKASWALHELLERGLTVSEVDVLGAASQDKRLSRIERHALREALQRRAKRSPP
jgi:hypothetical protein